jgi:tetratricopeptide (TPR) repeat protein
LDADRIARPVAAALCLLLTAQAPAPTRAPIDPDWTDCRQEEADERVIRGCTAVLARGARETRVDRAVAFALRGAAYFDLGDRVNGIGDHTAAIALDPGNTELWLARAWMLVIENRIDEAISDYDAALRLEPDNPDIRMRRSEVHRRAGRSAAARADLDAALRLVPESVDALVARGELNRAEGRLEEAAADLDAALALQPENAAAQQARQALSRQRGQ